MPMAAFDTISVAKRLENDFDMPQKQAEGVALVLHENFVGNVATKEDLKTQSRELSGKIKALDDKIGAQNKKMEGLATTKELAALDKKMEGLATTKELTALDEKIIAQNKKIEGLATKDEVKAEIAAVRTEIAQAANKTIYALGGLIGVLFVIDRLLPLFGTGG